MQIAEPEATPAAAPAAAAAADSEPALDLDLTGVVPEDHDAPLSQGNPDKAVRCSE